MSRTLHFIILLALLPGAILISGCSEKASMLLLNDGVNPGPPIFYGTVTVFASRQTGHEVEELGSVCVTINAEVAGSEYITRMQKEAAKIGAHAVVAYEQIGNTATGVAVRYRDAK